MRGRRLELQACLASRAPRGCRSWLSAVSLCESIAEVRATGVAMAAVISAISGALDAHAAAASLVREWNNA